MTFVLDYLISTLKAEGIAVVVGAMPPKGGVVAIQQSSGSVIAPYNTRSQAIRETYVVNAKDKKQKTAMTLLEQVHAILTKKKGYTSDSSYQIACISTLNLPDFLGQENNESYMYGSSIEVLVYDRRQAE